MANLKIKDGDNTDKYLQRTGVGSDVDPFVDSSIGSLTETSPATDTGSSGLNGRLQRIAQRITSVISLFAAAATLSDTDTNPTTTSVGAKNQIWDGTQWTRLKQAVTGSITSLVGIINVINLARYNATLPTLTDGEHRALQSTSRAELLVALSILGTQATIKTASMPTTSSDTAVVVDVRSYPAPVNQTATIASGQSLSGGVALNAAFPVALIVPSGWTTANITFQGSWDGGATYANARTSGGSEIMVNVTTAGDIYTLNPLDFPFTHIKVRSGTAATPVNQAASLTLVTRGAL